MVVISPRKRRRQAVVEGAQDAFIEECGVVLDPLLAPLGFHASHPSYKSDPNEFGLLYSADGDGFVAKYPRADIDSLNANAGEADLWMRFDKGAGGFEVALVASGISFTHRDLPELPDWRTSLAPVLSAIAKAVVTELGSLRDDTNGRHSHGDERIHIRLMNEYSCEVPLWPSIDMDTNVEQLISDELLSDLRAFASRWDAAISPEVSDDRWDGVAIMQSMVRARYALDRLVHPARRRAAATESEEMRSIGEVLRVRLESELGPHYRVTYVHG